MKRLSIIGIAVLLFASTATIASADDVDGDADATETNELSDAQKRKAQLLADYVVGEDAEEGDEPCEVPWKGAGVEEEERGEDEEGIFDDAEFARGIL